MFNFQSVTSEDLVAGVFDNLFRENEEFLVAFDLCRDEFSNQVQSILFQYEKLQKLFYKIDEVCKYDLQTFVQQNL